MKNVGKFFETQKQWLCVAVLALVCAGTAFAQAQPAAAGKKNAISFVNAMPLFKGFLLSNQDTDLFFFYLAPSYERLIAPHFSIGGELDMCFGSYGRKPNDELRPYFYFSMAAAWRYYPLSEQMEKLFAGAIIGFNVQSLDGKTKAADGGFAGALIGVNFGYKALLGKTFFIEPSMAFDYSKSPDWALGWQGGLRFGIEI